MILVTISTVQKRMRIAVGLGITLLIFGVFGLRLTSTLSVWVMLGLSLALGWISVEIISWLFDVAHRPSQRFATAYRELFNNKIQDNSAAVATLRKFNWPTPSSDLLQYLPDLRKVKDKSGDIPRMLQLGFANFRHADLSDLSLVQADFRWANLNEAECSRFVVTGGNFEHASLDKVQAAYSRWESASLERARAKGIILYGANLRYAKFGWATLEGAVLCNADFRYADITGVNMQYADLCGADLRHTTWLSSSPPNLFDIDIDEDTQMSNELWELYQQQNHNT